MVDRQKNQADKRATNERTNENTNDANCAFFFGLYFGAAVDAGSVFVPVLNVATFLTATTLTSQEGIWLTTQTEAQYDAVDDACSLEEQ